jgi:hypothetical protein
MPRVEPIHVKALRSYARWTKKADAKVAETIASLSKDSV